MGESLTCPGCGADVPGMNFAAFERSGDDVTWRATEQIECPNCGIALKRETRPGAGWEVADG